MPEVPIFLSSHSHSHVPLTRLTEEEQMFFSTVRRFAEDAIAPVVRAMDDEQQLAHGLLQKLTELGLLGILVLILVTAIYLLRRSPSVLEDELG